MTTDNIIDLLIIACGWLLVWLIVATLTLWHERRGNRRNNRSKTNG